MKIASGIIIFGYFISSTIALACTQEEALKKAQDTQVLMMAAIKQDPAKRQMIIAKATEKMREVSAKFLSTKNFDEACKAYDEIAEGLH